jgi:2-polyprenyl-6-methoxyphenol hydroxylase-like FAD-dependent oxidoreductase
MVVGAGPVGLALANDLARRGVDFRIVDALPGPMTRSKAHGFMGHTVEVLDVLGLAQPIMASARTPAPHVELRTGRIVAHFGGQPPHEPYPYSVAIMQQRIERVFEAELERRGSKVERSTRFLGLEQDDEGVTVRLERSAGPVELAYGFGNTLSDGGAAAVDVDHHQEEVVRARWVVGVDGAHSKVRDAVGLTMDGWQIPGGTWVSEMDIDWERPRDVAGTFVQPTGHVAAMFDDFTGKWHLFVEDESLPRTKADVPDVAALQAAFRKLTGHHEAVLSNPAWIGFLETHQRMPKQVIVDRVVLAGDAAHVHSAAGGQGMNTGVQDAVNLGWKLDLVVSGAAAPGLLQTYDEERAANARKLLDTTAKNHRVMLPRLRRSRLKAALVLKATVTFGPAQRRLLQRNGMFGQNRRSSSLTRQGYEVKAKRFVAAGDFLPHASCYVAGQGGALRDVLHDPTANLLLHAGTGEAGLERCRAVEKRLSPLAEHLRVRYVFPSEHRARRAGFDPADDRVVIDGLGQVRTALSLDEPEAIYVRPDGYLGLRTRDLHPEGIVDYLRSIYAEHLFV